jgi:glycosyltransferase 2 family protein
MWNGFDVDMPPGYHGRQRRLELRYPRPMAPPVPRIAAWLKRLSPAIGIACFAIALLVLGRALRDTTPEALARQLATFPRQRILAALALTILDFVPLIGLDWYALRVMRRRLPFPVLARASVVGFAFSRAVGLAVLSGSAIRYRLCGRHGLYALDIAKLVAIAAVISWLGFLLVGGVALLAAPLSALSSFHLSQTAARVVGAFFLAILVAMAVAGMRRHSLVLGPRRFDLPPARDILGMIAVGSIDWILATAVPYVLLAPAGVGFAEFTAVYMVAQVAGVVSNVPAGIGVFETVMLVLLGGTAEPAAILGGLVVYRVVYYLLPLAVAAIFLCAFEIRSGQAARRRSAAPAER